jgi:hypothetical protein
MIYQGVADIEHLIDYQVLLQLGRLHERSVVFRQLVWYRRRHGNQTDLRLPWM